jgi:hypothetical protein|tara:strand:+ start:625 stop:1053 length:429 start_codon:yes stop_codon:yes gene_type:complete
MAHEFGVRWDGCCYLCKNPLDIRMKVSIDAVDDLIPDMVTFFEHHPKYFGVNDCMWKVRSGRAYRCCKACWEKPWPVPNPRNREVTGRFRRGGIRSGSLTQHEIYTWFKSLHYYIKMDPEGKYKRIPISEMSQGSGIILQVS